MRLISCNIVDDKCKNICSTTSLTDHQKHRTITFPLMLDMILYVEVDGDVGSDSSRPALSNIWLGNFHNREGGDWLSHPGPAPKHDSTIL